LDRRTFVCTLTGSLLAAPLAAAAQQAGKVYRIGVLMNKASDPAESRQWQGLWLGLRERGWIQGENILVELREAEGNSSRVPDLAADLVRRKMDLIVTRGSLFTGAVKAATSSIPIVFIAHADPVGSGHVASLARPGGNITGLAILQTELGAKGLEILRSVGPTVTRIAVLWHPGTPSAAPGLKALEEPARRLRLELQPVGARGPAELEGAFAAMARARAQGVIVLATPIFFGERQRLGELAIAHRLPTMFQIRDYAEAGGLMSYGGDLADLYRRAAILVDKILKGAKPGDIPIEQPTKFELIINLKTAKALGLTIPQSLLQRADQVIE
jgi:putative tryptophan/tyrosine transport system substrate-binding protein